MRVAVESFARSFTQARDRFLDAVRLTGAPLESHRHPLPGPGGEVLFTDVARIGPAAASRLLIMISGVHGVEHYAGSACMIDWLTNEAAHHLPTDTGILLIHAINPWGAAHFRRYNEDNIDLARNFIDFSQQLRSHAAYEAVHAAISSPDRDVISSQLGTLFDELGDSEAIEALMSGQFSYPQGFSFGGTQPCWSHRLLIDIVTRHAAAAKAVSVIEYHSGLGPYGYGMLVTMQTGEPLARLRAAFGEELHSPRADDGLHSAPGHTTDGLARALGAKRMHSIVLEFGTFPPSQSLPVLLDDHWLTHHGDPASDAGRAIKARILEMHCPDDPQWESGVLDRSREIIGGMLQMLSA